MRITVCLTQQKPEPWVAGLQAALPGAQVSAWQPGDPPADWAVVWAPPQAFIDEQTDLRALFNTGAGVDALLQLRLPPGLRVVRLDDAGMSVQMAEYVCHAVIRHFREFDGYEADIREARWSYRKPRSRADWPVGVMGLGVLGARVAQALRVFDFPVHGWSRGPREVPGVVCHAGEAALDGFLASCRVLVNLLPLTPQTENILNRQTLGRLLPGGYLINVARGAHLVDDDLLALLESGHLAGATLDVFRTEPLPAASPFWRHPKVTLTPHNAADSDPDAISDYVVAQIRAYEAGQALQNIVDRARGY